MATVREDPPRSDDPVFLGAIAAEWDSDVPRLVYADWLEERGFAKRSEFIRIQCALANRTGTEPTHGALRARESELWQVHGFHEAGWAGPLLRWGVLCTTIQFTRGFLHEITARPSTLEPHGAELFDRFPTVRRVAIEAATQYSLRRLTRLALLRIAPEINFGLSGLGNSGCEILANECDWLVHTRSLSLSCNGVSDAGVAALMRSPALAGGLLEELNLCANNLGDVGIEEMANSPAMRSVRRLKLSHNRITDEGARVIARASALQSLEELDLSQNHVSQDGIRAALDSANLPRLRTVRQGSGEVESRERGSEAA
jgi:uncharacterized protein (TIGR02996 family)